MHPLHEQLQNPLTRGRDALVRERLASAFPALRSCSDQHFLSLGRYLTNRPERFFDEVVCEIYLDWLQKHDETDSEALKEYIHRFDTEISHALLFLREVNSEDWHDRQLKDGDGHDLARFIDKHVHPTYLRLVEAVLAPLTRPLAYFSRLDRGKGTEGLEIWSIAQELEKKPTSRLVEPYRNIIRNGIAHGGITFLQNEIRYRDKKGNEEKFYTEAIVRLFDDLLDTCNGLAAALKVFFLVLRDQGYIPPRELLVEELLEETRSPWWTIEGSVESEIDGQSQLTVYARPNSRQRSIVQWSTIQSGILAEYFAPGYDRYFFFLHSQKAWPGFAAFDGKKLCDLRTIGADTISQYAGALEGNLLFYVPRPAMPAFLGKLDTFAKSFRISMPIVMQRMREKTGLPHIVCRDAAAHRNSWGAVLNAAVVIDGVGDETTVDVIRKYRRRFIKAAIKHARNTQRLSGAAYLPLGYAQVSVFRRDYRRRRLSGFGLGDDLVCTIRFQRLGRIKSPDILGSTVETAGRWRIAWNKSWLDSSGAQLE